MELVCSCVAPGAEDGRLASRLVDSPPDWPRVLELSTHHHVIPMVYRALNAAERRHPGAVPPEFLGFLQRAQRTIAAYNLRAASILQRMLAEMEEQGIQLIPIKGPALAVLARQDLALRQFEDLDLVVRREDLLRAVEGLERGGYALRELPPDIDRSGYLETLGDWALHKPGVPPVDLKPVLISHTLSGAETVEALAGLCRPLDLGTGRVVQAPGPEGMFWAVCLDGAQEMWLKLSSVADAAQLLAAHADGEWGGVLREAARFGHDRSLRVGARLAEILLGADVPRVLRDAAGADAEAGRLAEEAAARLRAGAPSLRDGWRQKWYACRTLSRLRDRGRFAARLLFVPGPVEIRSRPGWVPGGVWAGWRPFRLAWDVTGRGGRHRRVRSECPGPVRSNGGVG